MRVNESKSTPRAPRHPGALWLAAATLIAAIAGITASGCAAPLPATEDGCPPPATECGSACVNTATDAANCGDCGRSCSAGQTCSDGVCGFVCLGAATRCGNKCVLLDDDPANCGACGEACAPGAACASGACSLVCPGGASHCGGACVNTASDPQNCGGCGEVCQAGQVCSQGTCSKVCDPALAQCGAACVDIFSDPSNCGGCFSPCPAGESCSSGFCQCPSGHVSCGNGCVALQSDHDNCGGCFASCAADEVCAGGACQCANGLKTCGGACTDLQTDPMSCGACNNACGPGLACVGGACACAPGTTTCSGVCVNTAISPTSCGGCNIACAAGQVCNGGVCSAPTGAWSMLGNDAQHSGWNAQETGKPPLFPAFTVALGPGALSPPAVSQGRVIVSNHSSVQALNVSDGSPLWSYPLGGFSVGFPTAVGDKVYVQSCNQTPGTYLWIIDAATGTPSIAAPFSAQWEHYWPPLVVNDTVYIDGGYYGGLDAFNGQSGAPVFSSNALEQYDEWSPAYFNGSVYTFVEGSLRAHDPLTGNVQWTTSVPWNWAGWSMDTAPVFGSAYAYVISPPDLYAVNPATHAVAWTASGAYHGVPATANGAVYALTGGSLIVRDAATGALLWSFVGDANLTYPPVIAAGFVYVASDNNVYAVDITSHAQVWTAPSGGWLAVASGRLLVSRQDGTLAGYLLSP
jgi:outer membrane protein assembly factor BamB